MNKRTVVRVSVCSVVAAAAAFLASTDYRSSKFFDHGTSGSVLTDGEARMRLLHTAERERSGMANSASQDLLRQEAAEWAEIERWHRDRRNQQ